MQTVCAWFPGAREIKRVGAVRTALATSPASCTKRSSDSTNWRFNGKTAWVRVSRPSVSVPGVVLPLANLDKAIAELSVADVHAGGGVDVKPPPFARGGSGRC